MLKIFQVDAFTKNVFGGNPAAVVPLDHWLDDTVLQAIGAENNLAETAFTVPTDDGWELRWFTPLSEVALCGHATLATAYVMVTHLNCTTDQLNFHTRESGTLVVEKHPNGKLAMSFPAIPVSASIDKALVTEALGAAPTALFQGSYAATEFDYMAVFDSQAQVAALTPDSTRFKQLGSRGVIATAPGTECDFVSRYFAPNVGIDEDPVTGSAHCLLTPYWADQLNKNQLEAQQISARRGDLQCTLDTNNRVIISGYAADYMSGSINIHT